MQQAAAIVKDLQLKEQSTGISVLERALKILNAKLPLEPGMKITPQMLQELESLRVAYGA